MVEVICGGCGEPFEAKTRRRKWCSDACKMRHRRGGSETVAPSAVDEAPADPPADEGLLAAVRRELAEAGRLDTIAGQLAVQLARQVTAVDAKGVAGLSKELRAVLTEALEGVEPTPPSPETAEEPPAEADDEVARAREARERKARDAAGRA